MSQVRTAIDAFITVYNPEAHPFEWTKEVVHQVRLRKLTLIDSIRCQFSLSGLVLRPTDGADSM